MIKMVVIFLPSLHSLKIKRDVLEIDRFADRCREEQTRSGQRKSWWDENSQVFKA